MDLLNLAAKITLDDSQYVKGVKNAESMGQQLAGKMSAMTVAVGNLAADMVKKGVSAISDVISGAIDGYADYQQLIGGVETLFKKSSDKVANYAKQSFKTTGLSANEYMETVTSFSASLLQGLNGDTEAAAELANTAITDMADNANKMGTDISSIQAAYMGFAKQNYTMLDNLKLGYGGTASEMVRLINDSGILDHEIKNLDDITFDQLIEAIHAVQTELGVTGTTAKEAKDTISGSKASLSAAWLDMLSAVGGEGGQERLNETFENFKTSFTDYFNNFLPSLVATIVNSGSLVETIAEAISSLPTDVLSKVAQAGLEGGADMLTGVTNITSWIIESIANMFTSASIDSSSIEKFGSALGEFLGTTISDLVKYAPDILTGVFDAGVSLAGSFIEGLFSGLFGQGKEVDAVNKELSESLGSIEFQTTKASAILDYMDSLVQKYGEAATDTVEWKGAEEELEGILNGSGKVFESYGKNVQGAINKLRDMNKELKEAAIMNALQKASEEQLEMLTRQTLEYNTQSARAERNTFTMESARQNVLDYIIANAADAAASYKEEAMARGVFENQDVQDYYNQLIGYASGKNVDNFGNVIGDLADLDFGTLKTILTDLTGDSKKAEEIVSANEKMYKEAEAEVKDAQSKMSELQGEIDATKEAIENTKLAMDQTVVDLLGSGEDSAKAINTAGDWLASALNTVAGKIGSVSIPVAVGSTGLEGLDTNLNGKQMFFAKPRAIGIDTVPFNGYLAELHKGEAVLTRREADEWRSGMNYVAFADAVGFAVEDAISKMYINMSGEKVADITTRRIGNNISANSYSRVRAMGG